MIVDLFLLATILCASGIFIWVVVEICTEETD